MTNRSFRSERPVPDEARDLLLTALRVGDSRIRAEQLAHADPRLWSDVLELARRHRVAPLLYSQLKALGVTRDLSPDILQRLRLVYLGSASRNVAIYRELGRVLQAFRCENIPVIVLKGAFLAEAVYGNIAVRSMGDVDLLAESGDLARVDSILRQLGYRKDNVLREAVKENNHFGYHSEAGGLYVEVHWSLVSELHGVEPDTIGLWERAYPCPVAGIPVLAMHPEDLLLHLLLHASLETYQAGLRSIYDITATLQRYAGDIDWRRLQQRVHEWRMTRCAYLGLHMAQEFLRAPVPPEFLRSLSPDEHEMTYMTLAAERLMNPEDADQALPASMELVRWWMREPGWRKAMLLLRRLFPPRGAVAMEFPVLPDSPWIWLFYPIHIRDELLRHGQTAWSLWRGEREIRRRAERQNQINALQDWLLSNEV